jgi:hypothetical protein
MQVAFMLSHDLCNDQEAEKEFAAAFPLWAEMGAMPSHVFTVERSAWDSARWRVSKDLLAAAIDQIDAGHFADAGEEIDPHISEEDGALIAYFHAHGENVCCLIGRIVQSLCSNYSAKCEGCDGLFPVPAGQDMCETCSCAGGVA